MLKPETQNMKTHLPFLLGFFLVAVLITGCHRASESDNQTKDSTSIYVRDSLILETEHPKLADFRFFVHDLDSTEIASAPVAIEFFRTHFTNQRPGLCDSAFVILQQLLDTVEFKLNNKLYQDTLDYSVLLNEEDAPPAMRRYLANLTKNGFKLSFSEGLPYVEQDREFLLNQLSDMFTESMHAYLVQIELENREGFAQDAYISIEPESYIERLIWYENFIAANKTFVMLRNCKEYRKAYFTYLLTGMDNSPLYEDALQMLLSEYFSKAYKYLLKKYPNSETAGLVAPYYDAIRKKQKQEVSALFKKYLIAGYVFNLE